VNPLEFVFKLLWTAWPFVKEMVLEGRSLKHAFQINRRRAIFSIVIMASFLFNILNLGVDGRMVTLLMKYVKLDKTYQALVTSDATLKLQLANNCKVPVIVAPAASSQEDASEGEVVGSTDYELLKNSFTSLNSH
jgi:hypothetical protein